MTRLRTRTRAAGSTRTAQVLSAVWPRAQASPPCARDTVTGAFAGWTVDAFRLFVTLLAVDDIGLAGTGSGAAYVFSVGATGFAPAAAAALPLPNDSFQIDDFFDIVGVTTGFGRQAHQTPVGRRRATKCRVACRQEDVWLLDRRLPS